MPDYIAVIQRNGWRKDGKKWVNPNSEKQYWHPVQVWEEEGDKLVGWRHNSYDDWSSADKERFSRSFEKKTKKEEPQMDLETALKVVAAAQEEKPKRRGRPKKVE